MPKRKKHPKLPSGWGSIRYLGKGRRNPYAVHPPAVDQDPRTGHYIQPKALCYVDDWYVGFAVLNAYRAGTYKPGDELQMKEALSAGATSGDQDKKMDALIERIIKDSNKATRAISETLTGEDTKTLEEVYAEWYEWKCGEFSERKPSESTINGYRLNWIILQPLKDKPIDRITTNDVQKIINSNIHRSQGSLRGFRTFVSMIFKYAIEREMRDKNPVDAVIIPANAKETETGQPFSIEEIKRLSAVASEDQYCELALILCYTGHRISELGTAKIDMDQKIIVGGVKTASGKNRIVPIHSYIVPLIEKRIKKYGNILGRKSKSVSTLLPIALKKYGMNHHTHECRHTFSMLCERYGVPENDRKRLMGHSFGQDITNAVYGHRTVEDLRKSIEMIPPPENL